MFRDSVMNMYHKLRLLSYRNLFRRGRDKGEALSATEAFSADVIHLLGEPTVSQFAGYIGISQPNATYKVNNLMAKGYVQKVASETDRREFRLQTGSRYKSCCLESNDSLEAAVQKLNAQFSSEELKTTARVLDVLLRELDNEEDNEE